MHGNGACLRGTPLQVAPMKFGEDEKESIMHLPLPFRTML